MAYTNGKPGYIWLGKSYPATPATEVYCDACANAGAVPFDVAPCRNPACEHEGVGGVIMGRPAVAPTCPSCTNPYRIQQQRGWSWCPIGWDSEVDRTPCGKCGQPAASGRPFWYREAEAAPDCRAD